MCWGHCMSLTQRLPPAAPGEGNQGCVTKRREQDRATPPTPTLTLTLRQIPGEGCYRGHAWGTHVVISVGKVQTEQTCRSAAFAPSLGRKAGFPEVGDAAFRKGRSLDRRLEAGLRLVSE